MAPLSTQPVSINDIVGGQQPDDTGRTLPHGALHGLATWLTLSTPKIFGMLVQSDPINGLIRPYACSETYAVCSVANDPLTLSVGTSDNTYANLSACGTNGDCSCVESCGSGSASASSYDWYLADNSGVVSLTSNPVDSYGQYRGDKLGNTYPAVNVIDNLGCGGSGTGPINVTSCPATLLVGTTYTPTLANNDPPYRTGVGLIATMMASAGHDGAQISEAITNGSNSCPIQANCGGGEPFTVGPPNATQMYGIQFPNVDNAFYDQHVILNGSDILGGTGVTSCSVTCNQTYSCGGVAIGKFAIKYNLNHGTLNGQGVTNVSAVKTATN
ncbi:MAG: hypothetical protein M3Y72_23815 [Acidobacteriota bacterium]|nr:hypothetical protein [Acidobacteriota bacterium]